MISILKQHSAAPFHFITYNLVKIRLLELQAEAKELNQPESKGMNIVIELILLFNLLQAPLDHKWQSH